MAGDMHNEDSNQRRTRTQGSLDFLNLTGGADRDAAKMGSLASQDEQANVRKEIAGLRGQIGGRDDIAQRYMPRDYAFETNRWDPKQHEAQSSADTWLADEQSIAAQRAALEGLQGNIGQFEGLYNQSGIDAIARADIEQQQALANQQARAQRETALQNLAARGMGGSGAAQMAQLAGGQMAANAGRQARMQALAMGQMRRDNALMQAQRGYGQLAGQAGDMRGQSFGEARDRGRAVDAFNLYNTEGRRGILQRDMQARRQYDERRSQARRDADQVLLDTTSLATNQGLRGAQMTQGRSNQNSANAEARRTGIINLAGAVLG